MPDEPDNPNFEQICAMQVNYDLLREVGVISPDSYSYDLLSEVGVISSDTYSYELSPEVQPFFLDGILELTEELFLNLNGDLDLLDAFPILVIDAVAVANEEDDERPIIERELLLGIIRVCSPVYDVRRKNRLTH